MPLPEKALIAKIGKRIGRIANRQVRIGLGDDSAVIRIPDGHEALVTTDFSMEGIHFRREWHPAGSVGHRCLARGLSDIAAMGGRPVAAFLSLALPASLPQRWVDGFVDGLLKLAQDSGVVLAGGDTAESPSGVLADIIVLGSAPRGKAILRSGARAGDQIYVTGELGGSAAALDQFSRNKKSLRIFGYKRHFYPVPRIAVGQWLREHAIASAMIDLSDGLSTDLAHICEESGVGAVVEARRLPLASVGQPRTKVDLNFALHGGEDYELLFTARPKKKVPRRVAGVSITPIGEITKGEHVFLSDAGTRRRLPIRGWEHFLASRA